MNFSVKNNNKILILGCGYVGSSLAEKWLSDGYEVWAVNRSTDRLQILQQKGLKVVKTLVQTDDWHEQIPSTFSLVVNCVSAGGGGLQGYQDSYLGGNRFLAKWAKKSQVDHIIYTSSTGVYPFYDGRIVKEEDAGGDLSESGQILWEAESVLREDRTLRPKTTILRLSGIYGPGRHYLLDSLRRKPDVLPGRGDVFLNLIHRDDIVKAVELVGETAAAKGETFNLSDNEPTAKSSVVEWLATKIGVPVPVFDPTSTSGRRIRVSASGHSPNRRISNEKIRNLLGWQPLYPSFREGFSRIIEGEQ